MNKYEQLKRDLMEATEYAKQFITDDDGGTCNFDSPELLLKGWQGKRIEAIVEEARLSCWKNGPGYWVITGFQIGQGNCRTTMAEKFAELMRKRGYEAYVHYIMD